MSHAGIMGGGMGGGRKEGGEVGGGGGRRRWGRRGVDTHGGNFHGESFTVC